MIDEKIALRNKVEELQEEVRQLRQLLVPPVVYPSEFKLTNKETALVSAISARSPKVMTREQVFAAIYYDQIDEYPDIKIIDVLVCKARKKMRVFGIDILTIWGEGFQLTEQSVRRLNAAVKASEEGRPLEIVKSGQETPLPVAPAPSPTPAPAPVVAIPAPAKAFTPPAAPARSTNLAPVEIKNIFAFRAAGHGTAAIARFTGVPKAEVDLALKMRVERRA